MPESDPDLQDPILSADPTNIGTPEIGLTPSGPVPETVRKPAGLPSHLSLPRQVLAIAAWPTLEQIANWTVWYADSALAGYLPDHQQAVIATESIGAASYLTWLMGLLQGAVGIGATALISRAVGGRYRRVTEAATGQAILLAILWGTAFGLFFFVTAPWWIAQLRIAPESVEGTVFYLRLMAVAAPFMATLYVGSASLRGAGDVRTPFRTMMLVNIINIAVSVFLVKVGGYGLYGIAIGTVVAWMAGGLYTLYVLIHGHGALTLYRREMKWQKNIMNRLIAIGLPSVFENGSMWLGQFIIVGAITQIQHVQNPLGSQIIAIRLEGLSFLPGFAFSVAAATMTGQYLGARSPDMARRAGWTCWAYGTAGMVFLGILFMTIPEVFVRMMTNKEPFITDVPPMLFMAGWAQIGFATSMIFSGVLKGAGDTRTTMWINLILTFCVRIPLVYLAVYHFHWGLTGVWGLLSGELMLRGLVFFARFYSGRWAKVKV